MPVKQQLKFGIFEAKTIELLEDSLNDEDDVSWRQKAKAIEILEQTLNSELTKPDKKI